MMHVFKPKYTKNGSHRISRRWHVQFRDHTNTRRRLLAFTDKAMSEELGRKVVKLVATVAAGERPDPGVRSRSDFSSGGNPPIQSGSRPILESTGQDAVAAVNPAPPPRTHRRPRPCSLSG